MPLTYSGLLTDPSGTPLTGKHSIDVQLRDGTGKTVLCDAGTAVQDLVVGRFSVALPDACATAVHANPDVQVQVIVDTATFTSKLGAVPYALEAGAVDYANVRGVGGAWPGTITRTAGSKVTITKNGKTVALDATVCGVTPVQPNANVGGYAAINTLCRAVSTCGANAHICTPEEALRTAWLGVYFDVAAVATASFGSAGSSRESDCDGFRYGGTDQLYSTLGNSSSVEIYPSTGSCASPVDFLCCD